MKTCSRFAYASLVALAISAAACGGSTATDQGPQTAQSALTTAPVGAQTHGPVKLFGDALGDVPLRADQRAELETLATDAEARHQSIVTARKDLAAALAAQVEAGSIDRAALQPKIDAMATAWASVQDADRAALERVHALLDASQRAKFADALKARMAAAKGAHNPREHMKEWAAELNLSDAQKDQIKQALQDQMKAHAGAGMHAEMKAHHENAQKFLDAFKGDHFVMDEVAPKKDPKTFTDRMSGRMIGMMQAALPILTAEQRSLAAQKIRTRSVNAAVMEHPVGF